MSASRIDETKPFLPVRIAVLTVSDTRTRENDTSGDTLVERLTGAAKTLLMIADKNPRALLEVA